MAHGGVVPDYTPPVVPKSGATCPHLSPRPVPTHFIRVCWTCPRGVSPNADLTCPRTCPRPFHGVPVVVAARILRYLIAAARASLRTWNRVGSPAFALSSSRR